jgi:hypothetical protein
MKTKRSRRVGRTVNRSVSFSPETLQLLEQRAERVHGGNLSAAIADAASLLRLEEARQDVAAAFEALHGPLTDRDRDELEAEQRSASTRKKRRVA